MEWYSPVVCRWDLNFTGAPKCVLACVWFALRATLLGGPSYTWLGTSLVPLRSTITTDNRVCSGRRCYGQPSNKLPPSYTTPQIIPLPTPTTTPQISFIPLRFFCHYLQTISMCRALILTQTFHNLADSLFKF